MFSLKKQNRTPEIMYKATRLSWSFFFHDSPSLRQNHPCLNSVGTFCLCLLRLGSSAQGRFHLGHTENEYSTSFVCVFFCLTCGFWKFWICCEHFQNWQISCITPVFQFLLRNQKGLAMLNPHFRVVGAEWWLLSIEGACALWFASVSTITYL